MGWCREPPPGQDASHAACSARRGAGGGGCAALGALRRARCRERVGQDALDRREEGPADAATTPRDRSHLPAPDAGAPHALHSTP